MVVPRFLGVLHAAVMLRWDGRALWSCYVLWPGCGCMGYGGGRRETRPGWPADAVLSAPSSYLSAPSSYPSSLGRWPASWLTSTHRTRSSSAATAPLRRWAARQVNTGRGVGVLAGADCLVFRRRQSRGWAAGHGGRLASSLQAQGPSYSACQVNSLSPHLTLPPPSQPAGAGAAGCGQRQRGRGRRHRRRRQRPRRRGAAQVQINLGAAGGRRAAGAAAHRWAGGGGQGGPQRGGAGAVQSRGPAGCHRRARARCVCWLRAV